MKRSEMKDHIYEEIKEALENRQYSNETDEKYWRRKSAGLLDMILGLGMLPPTRYWEGAPPLTLEMPVKSNTWDPEDK